MTKEWRRAACRSLECDIKQIGTKLKEIKGESRRAVKWNLRLRNELCKTLDDIHKQIRDSSSPLVPGKINLTVIDKLTKKLKIDKKAPVEWEAIGNYD